MRFLKMKDPEREGINGETYMLVDLPQVLKEKWRFSWPLPTKLIEEAKAEILEEVKLRVPPLYRDQIVWSVTPYKHSIRVACQYWIPAS